MRCPTLEELPAPPPGKSGWPWTVQCAQAPERTPSGGAWPKISIVTPSYAQGAFIEETIRSILLQGYPSLEYIVMDGGSRDETVAVLEKYDAFIDHWRSEKDEGQADAINKGFALCSGSIFQFINSDDLLAPDCLARVGAAAAEGAAVVGDVANFSSEGETIHVNSSVDPNVLLHIRNHVHQPGVWLDAERMRQLGPFDISYSYYFDTKYLFEYFDRFPSPVVRIEAPLVRFRIHAASKSVVKDQGGDAYAARVAAEKDRMALELSSTAKSEASRLACADYLAIRAWEDKLRDIEMTKRPRLLKLVSGAALAFNHPEMALTKESKRFFRRVLRGRSSA